MSQVDDEPCTKPKQKKPRSKKRSVWTRQKMPKVHFSSPRERKKTREISYERKQTQVIHEVLRERLGNFESKCKQASGEAYYSDDEVPREGSAPRRDGVRKSNENHSENSAADDEQEYHKRRTKQPAKPTKPMVKASGNNSEQNSETRPTAQTRTKNAITKDCHSAAGDEVSHHSPISNQAASNNGKQRVRTAFGDHNPVNKQRTTQSRVKQPRPKNAGRKQTQNAHRKQAINVVERDTSAQNEEDQKMYVNGTDQNNMFVFPRTAVKLESDLDMKPVFHTQNEGNLINVAAAKARGEKRNRKQTADSPEDNRGHENVTVDLTDSEGDWSLDSEEVRLAKRQCNSLKLIRQRRQLGGASGMHDKSQASNKRCTPCAKDGRSPDGDYSFVNSFKRDSAGREYAGTSQDLRNCENRVATSAQQATINGKAPEANMSDQMRFLHIPKENLKRFGACRQSVPPACTATRLFVRSADNGRPLGACGMIEIGARCSKAANPARKPTVFSVIFADALHAVIDSQKFPLRAGDYFFVGAKTSMGFVNASCRDALLSYSQFATESDCYVIPASSTSSSTTCPST